VSEREGDWNLRFAPFPILVSDLQASRQLEVSDFKFQSNHKGDNINEHSRYKIPKAYGNGTQN